MTTRTRGFTLIEVVVTLSLLSLLILSMAGVMQTIGQTTERVDQRLDKADEMRTAVFMLRQVLGRVSGQKTPPADATASPIVQFRAATNAIEWLGVMPARPGVGGRYFFRLQVETNNNQSQLVLRFLPWSLEPTKKDWNIAERRILVRNATQLLVSAQGLPKSPGPLPEGWPQGWVSGWPRQDTLPDRVKIQLTTPSGDWPEITIPVYELTQGQGIGQGFAIGGGAR
jgi:general secretion pathway protein J